MFGLIKKFWGSSEKPRVFLKSVEFVPQKSKLRAFERFPSLSDDELGSELKNQLETVFALPGVPSEAETLPTDLCVEVFLYHYLAGMSFHVELNSLHLPLFWRPEVELRARLSRVQSGEIIMETSVKQRPTWREFAKQEFVGTLLFWKQGGGREEMKVLLNNAALRIMKRLATAASR